MAKYDYKFAGIKTDITNAKTAIQDYLQSIDTYIDNVKNKFSNDGYDISKAYKGTYATAIKQYLAEVADSLKNIKEPLKKCEDALDKALAAYNAKDAEIKPTMGTTSAE